MSFPQALPPGLRRPAPGVAVVVFVAAVGAVGVWSELRGAAWTPPPAVGAYLIAVAAAGALFWRRRVGALLLAAAVCTLYHLLGYPGYGPAAALGVGAYLVAAYGDGLRSVVVAAALVVAFSAVPLLPPHPAPLTGAVYGPFLIALGAVAVGEAARARRTATVEHLRAVHRAAAQEAHRRVVEDRLSVAREVHDVLAHTVAVIAVQAAAGADALAERPDEARAAFGAIRGSAKEAMTELRTTLAVLRGAESGSGLAPGPAPTLDQLPQLVAQTTAAGIEVVLELPADAAAIPPAVQRVVFRVVQEALTNVVRHSRARRATACVTATADAVEVHVTDPGPAAATDGDGPGNGLLGLRERVVAAGGSIDAGPTGTGFGVHARLPRRVGP